MIAEEPVVKGWAISTESKIKQLIDDFIINYPQANVRKTTSRLLTSLFKRGNEEQRLKVMKLLIERVQLLSSMGKSSQQFLTLINKIFDLFPEQFINQKTIIFNQVWARTKEIFNKITSNKEYEFYSLSSNMIDFGQQFKPYLLEANGCLKCFGRPDVEFQQTNINNIREQLRVHLNSSQWVLKRTYQINNFQMNFIKKKVSFKSMTLYYYDQNGVKKQLGKFTPNDNIPTYNLTTNTIGINFEFNKIRRSHISCIICSSSQEYASLCSSCIGKLIEMQGNVKVVGGNPQKINKELSDSFKTMNQLRTQLEQFSFCVANQSKITPLRSKIISEMESSYTNIIQNLKLLRNLSENELKTEKEKYAKYSTDCYSCHFFEFNSCINFIFQTLKKPNFKVDLSEIMNLIQDFKSIFFHNKIKDLNARLSSIVSQLFNRVLSIDYLNQLPIQKSSSHLIVRLLINLIEHLKVSHKANSQLLQDLKKYVFNPSINSFFKIKQKIQLFVMLELNDQYFYLLSDNSLQIEKLQDLKRLSLEEFIQYKTLLNFNINQIFSFNITNIVKIFLVLLPQELIPQSRLDIVDPAYLKFIKNVPPVITDQFIFSNIVFTPNPILKLNIFKLLPQLIQLLTLQESIELIKTLCKYKPLWNTYIIEAVNRFDNMLEAVQKERRMMLCLQGYDVSKQNLYFEHIYKMLTPQRTSFIIRLQIPQKEMQKEQKNKGGPVQYIYLPIREVKSEDLKSDTIGGLHQWITEQIRKLGQDMPFDLIVQNNIIDNMDLSLEIVYKKIVQKQAKRQIGNKTYDFFRVIYRIQGIFGQANQRISGNPRDQKYEECINFSTHLLTKLPIKKTGLDILMDIIPNLQKEPKDKKDKFIKILGITFKYQSIIKKIVEWGYGNYILSMAVKNISLTKQQLKSTQMLLQMCSKIIDQANLQMVKIRKNSGAFGGRKMSQGQMDIEGDNQQSEKAVKFVLQRVKEAQQSGFKHISKKLIKILPFCSKDDMLASKYLFQYFQVNKIFEIKYSQKLTWLLEFIHALSESYSSFKSICKQQGVTDKMVQIIGSGLKILDSQKIKENIDLLELCFSLCKGLIQGDMHLQQLLFEKQILQEIYRLLGSSQGGLSEQKRVRLGKIPLICFQIIKYFQEGKIINHQVHQFFLKIEQQKKKLNKIKNLQRKKQIVTKNQQIINKYKTFMVQQDEKLGCSSCKLGYTNNKEVLGVYLYSTKIEILQLESWWKDNKKTQNITSTSYFEPIHLQCHIQAMKNDLKLQKTEWDGALVRNSDVLCNNWCPFKGPETTDEQFDRALKKYFEKNNKNLSFWIALNDLNGLLERFSKEYNFALQIKGSSYTHNAKLIPVLISITSHLLKNNEDMKYLKEGIAFIESNQTKKPNLVYLYFTLFLFTTNYTTFNSKKTFCLKLIENMGYGHFKDSKPFYVQLALIKSIMKVTHNNINQGTDILVHLNSFIPKNFVNLIQSFVVIAEQYKNVMLKWQNVEQAKLYFDQ